MKCECHGCDHRQIGCHATCESYKAYRVEREQMQIQRVEKIKLIGYEQETYRRLMRKKRAGTLKGR